MMASSTAEAVPTRLLWVTENHPPSPGGMARSSDRIVANLRAAGVVVDVLHLSRAHRRARATQGEGGRLFVCPVGDDPEHALRRAYAHVDADHTHVVAFGGTLPLLAAPVYAAWRHVPLITLLRGNDFDTGVFSVRRRRLVLDAIGRSARVAVVARSQLGQVRALAGDGVDVSWITNGIGLDDWVALPADLAHAAAWRAANVPAGRSTIGVVGQLKAKKGVALLLEALAGSRRRDHVHLVLVGDIDPEVADHLDRMAAAGRACTRLAFLDRYDLLRLYPAFDFVALPSFYDGLPNVALEAAALGVPLLASDGGGLADLVVDGRNGVTFPAGDLAACRHAIDRAIGLDPDQRAALGHEGRRIVETEFSARRETEAYLRLLRGARLP